MIGMFGNIFTFLKLKMTLPREHYQAYDKILTWYGTDEKRFVLAGYAGTGKTTLAKTISDNVESAAFCAYTGKAVDVLRQKGCKPVNTIHGLIYSLNSKTQRVPLDLLITDEYSMLNENMVHNVEQLARKVIYLGDPFQLPPIDGKCPLKPDMVLTQVHRQALDSPILRSANAVREGKTLRYCDEEGFKFQP